MSTPLILASGACIALGVVVLLWRLLPTTPDLGAAMKNFSGTDRRHSDTKATGQQAQIESWLYTHVPSFLLAHMPTRNLDIVGTSYAAHLTKKVTVAGALLIAPVFVSAALWVIGVPIPQITLLSLPLALLGWFLPDFDLTKQAANAREEFHLTVATYIELTGMAAKAGLSPSQALEVAAESGNSWVFERLQNANFRSRFASEQPWVGLTRLAKDSDVPELTELADIMRVGAEQGSVVYESLRAKGRTQRLGILNRESITANEATERMTIPMTLLGIVFVLILVGPSLMNLLTT